MVDAPRFHFMWQHIEGTSILTMRREDWTTLVGTLGAPVILDVRSTPMAGITRASSVVVSVAHQFGSASARVSVFRYDPADVPTPINLDEYDVWTDLSQHPRLPAMLAETSAVGKEEDVKAFCQENVFFVKQPPGPEHWLPSVPASITVLIRSIP